MRTLGQFQRKKFQSVGGAHIPMFIRGYRQHLHTNHCFAFKVKDDVMDISFVCARGGRGESISGRESHII